MRTLLRVVRGSVKVCAATVCTGVTYVGGTEVIRRVQYSQPNVTGSKADGTPHKIPNTVHGIDPLWLSQALGEEVTHVEAVSLGEEAGASGPQLYKLTLTYAHDKAKHPQHMVLKYCNCADVAAKDKSVTQRIFRIWIPLEGFCRMEDLYYREHSQSGMPTATCYWTGVEDYGNVNNVLLLMGFSTPTKSALLLEDMSGRRKYSLDEVISESDAKSVLTALARLHATHWGNPPPNIPRATLSHYLRACRPWLLPTVESIQKVYGPNWPMGVNEEWKIFPGLPEVPSTIMSDVPQMTKHFKEDYTNHTFKLTQSLIGNNSGTPMTLNHGDCNLANYLFSDAKEDVPMKGIDWQLSGWAPCVNDVSWFINFNLPFNLEVEEKLLSGYHAELVKNGVKDYSWTTFRRHYDAMQIQFFAVHLFMGRLTEPVEVVKARLDADPKMGAAMKALTKKTVWMAQRFHNVWKHDTEGYWFPKGHPIARDDTAGS